MKLGRILIIFVVLILVFGIAFIVYSIHARLNGTEYQFQIDAVLTAASIENQEDPLTTDPAKCVVAEYDGKQYVVVPGNYLALSSYLRKDAASLLLTGPDKSKAVKLTVCDEAVIWAAPEGDSVDVVLVELTTMGKTFRMRTDGGNLWKQLIACCTEGTYHDDNIPLD